MQIKIEIVRGYPCWFADDHQFTFKLADIHGDQVQPSSFLNPDALTVNSVRSDPTVDATPVVADLKLLTLDGFDEVQKLRPTQFAQHDVTHRQFLGIHWFHHAQIARFDLPGHGSATRTKLHGLPILQLGDVRGGPTHGLGDSRSACGIMSFSIYLIYGDSSRIGYRKI